MLFFFHRYFSGKEFKIFPSLFFGFEKPILAIPNLAHLLLPHRQADALARVKELNSLHTQFGVPCTSFAHLAPLSQKRKPQAFGIFMFLILFSINSFAQQPNIGLPQQRQEQNNQIKQNNNNSIHTQTQQYNYKELDDDIKTKPTKKTSAPRFRFADRNSKDYQLNAGKYISAFNELNMMLLTDTAIEVKRAIFIVENAYLKEKIPYDKYLKLIQGKVNLIKHIIKKEKLDPANPDAIHYAIQKLFSDTLYIKQANGTIKIVKPFVYDFNDPFGEKDPAKQLVTKLLVTNNGQCHSMPLLYMILAEEFKIKSYLSYSPQHSFIKFQTKNGNWYNFETTNGRLTTDAFVLGSGFIKSEALKSGIFNQPHNTKEVVANMFIDLANNYQEQFGYDDFQQKCVDKNLKYNSNFIYAKVVQSNYQTALTDLALAEENYPNPKSIPNYPFIALEFQKRDALYDELDNLGFTSMPKDAYQQWLKSLKQGQEKQNSEDLKFKFTEQIKK